MLLHPESAKEKEGPASEAYRRWASKFRPSAVRLSDKNRQAYWHYRQCKAIGQFPADDAIVRRNAAIIASVLKSIDDLRLDRLFYLLGGRW